MTDSPRHPYQPDYAVPPGETLLETLEDRGMTQAELARRADRPLKTINEIIHGKAAITPETAIQLERVLGIRDAFWNKLELDYRAALARAEERRRLEGELGWLEHFPVKDMLKHGLIPRSDDRASTLASILSFFGVSTIAALEKYMAAGPQALFRQSTAFSISDGAVAIWLRWGQIRASAVSAGTYDPAAFLSALATIRRLTPDAPEVFEPEMKRLCAAAGVIVALIPELPETRVSGATQWLSNEKAILQLTVRGRRNDIFWFNFFHEAAHILNHGRKQTFVEGQGEHDDAKEAEANHWAADFLIPPAQMLRLRESDYRQGTTVMRFARELGIAPGIVVGRLQKDGHLPWGSTLNKLKRSFTLR